MNPINYLIPTQKVIVYSPLSTVEILQRIESKFETAPRVGLFENIPVSYGGTILEDKFEITKRSTGRRDTPIQIRGQVESYQQGSKIIIEAKPQYTHIPLIFFFFMFLISLFITLLAEDFVPIFPAIILGVYFLNYYIIKKKLQEFVMSISKFVEGKQIEN